MQINNNGITNNTTNGSASNQKTNSPTKTQEGVNTAVQVSGDSVELSQAAKAITELEAKIASVSDVDASRVASLKQAIADGSYYIDADSIASKILESDDLF